VLQALQDLKVALALVVQQDVEDHPDLKVSQVILALKVTLE
jgi:hypothetical protein